MGGTITNKTIHGKVHGKTIEFDEDLGVPEGQEVEVHVMVLSQIARMAREHSSQRGRLADDTESDSIMEQTHRQRKGGKP